MALFFKNALKINILDLYLINQVLYLYDNQSQVFYGSGKSASYFCP